MKTSSLGTTPVIPWRPKHAMTIPKLWIRNGPQLLNWATKWLHNPLLCSDRPPPLFVRSGMQLETAAFPCAIAFITQGMHQSVPWSLYICNLVYVSFSYIWFKRFWYQQKKNQEQNSFIINLNLNLNLNFFYKRLKHAWPDYLAGGKGSNIGVAFVCLSSFSESCPRW